jgi:CheY-like chemotaxis protein
MGDSYRIRQVVLNLLSNAVKFTDSGGTISLDLKERKINDQKLLLIIEVSDTGCGMSDNMQKRLFGKFEQEDATTVRKYGGSGLGLSISKSLIELMHGEIFVSSKLGVGTKFTVQIPLEIVKEPSLKTNLDISKLDALVVDNNKDTCKYINSILKSWKLESEYTTSSIKALEMVKNRIVNDNEYNLYIVDLRMPKMNGLELVKNIKAMIKSEALIILISGYDISEFKMEVEANGRENFLRKPVFPSELFNTLIARIGAKDILDSTYEQKVGVNLKGMKILLVEDDSINQLIAKKLLEMAGAIVIIANNGKEAVEEIKNKSNEVDLILMDIQMPIMDGYTATRKIRQLDLEYAKTIPIYALSANSFQKDIDKSLEAGMNGHISKPIEPNNLFAILEKNYKKTKDSR